MCNSIFINKETIPKAKDGEEVEITIKGVYRTDSEGVRKLDVEEVGGNPVIPPEEEESDCGCGGDKSYDEMGDAEDALRLFIIKKAK